MVNAKVQGQRNSHCLKRVCEGVRDFSRVNKKVNMYFYELLINKSKQIKPWLYDRSKMNKNAVKGT